jgi:hypothetical protein
MDEDVEGTVAHLIETCIDTLEAALLLVRNHAPRPDGGTVVHVHGALDPDAVAKQIEKILRRRGQS